MTAPVRLAHVVFRTNDLPAMQDWYCKVLTAHVVFGNEHLSFLTYDEEHHRIALIGIHPYEPKPEATTVGFYHSAFTFAGLNDLLATYDRLRKEGITPWRTINHGPTISFYYADPDGNDVELQVDRFADALDAQAWMKGEAFARNPIGIEIDPEEIRGRLLANEPVASIMTRSDEIQA